MAEWKVGEHNNRVDLQCEVHSTSLFCLFDLRHQASMVVAANVLRNLLIVS